MHDIDWDDPAARARLIEEIGIDAYNEAQAEARRRSVVATVNGYDIRPVKTRFGQLFSIDGKGVAFDTLDGAKEHAKTFTPGTAGVRAVRAVRVLLAVEDGEMEIWTGPGFQNVQLKSANVDDIAGWLIENCPDLEWTNSSSMDFADEYGWPNQDARADVVEALEKRLNPKG